MHGLSKGALRVLGQPLSRAQQAFAKHTQQICSRALNNCMLSFGRRACCLSYLASPVMRLSLLTGLPPPNQTWSLLAQPSATLMVAATQLSHCRRRRFAPAPAWMSVVLLILEFASGRKLSPKAPLWTPSVGPSYSRELGS